jgi:hyperosmotically inducible protein
MACRRIACERASRTLDDREDTGMSLLRTLMSVGFVGVVLAGPACADRTVAVEKHDAGAALDSTRAGADKAIDAAKTAGGKTAELTKDFAQKAVDKSITIAGELADKSQAMAKTTSATVTDGWITAKVKAKLADEIVLKKSEISVETNDRVVTLSGTAPSPTARARAIEIAHGTEGVARVIANLTVK